jgi:uncharacterized caspase-like protein
MCALARAVSRVVLLPLAWAACSTVAHAQAAPAESRIALVIGNAAYPTAPLRNPVNDAKAMADRLRTLGFEVALRTDVTQREMTRAVSQFGQALKPGAVALFYYAGHGMQVRGRNFLIPVDAEIASEASVRSEAVDVDLLLEQLGPARLSMVILDACRNNPFEGRFRSGGGGGLAQIDAPKGTLLAYATAPGKVASDGEGAHGLYTSELLKALDIPGIKVEEVFKAVRVNVVKATASQQVPWESSSLTGDYYFRPPAPAPDAVKIARDAQAKQAALQSRLDAEQKQREQDARLLKAEMEKLRLEVRRLTESSVAKEAKPPEVAKPVSAPPAKAKEPPVVAKAAPAAPAPAPERIASASATAKPATDLTVRERTRRFEILESQRGSLTLSKAVAVLLGPFTDEQLLVLVSKEKSLKNMPYSHALAIGITASGKLAASRHWGASSPNLAVETAMERCNRSSTVRCSAVIVNGEFREAAFLEWAGNARRESFHKLRAGFLGMRVE